MNEYIEFNNESIVESYIDSVYQEANEASKKLRKTTDEFLKDNYTSADLKKMTPKQRNRVKKFLKDSDYDPKTNTISTDIVDKSGKPVRVKFTTKGFENFSRDNPGGTLAPELVKQSNLDIYIKRWAYWMIKPRMNSKQLWINNLRIWVWTNLLSIWVNNG